MAADFYLAMKEDRAAATKQVLEDIQAKRLTTRAAARLYRLSKSYLQRRVNGQVAAESRNGPVQILTLGEEIGLVDAINERTLHAHCFTNKEFAAFVRLTVAKSPHRREIPESFPSDKWVQRFIARHSDAFSSRKSQRMEAVRAKRSTTDVVSAYFTNLSKIMQEKCFDADCIWNLDESGMNAQGATKNGLVLATKGMPANTQVSNCRRNVSVLACINAAGDHAPPFFIFPGKTSACDGYNAPCMDPISRQTNHHF